MDVNVKEDILEAIRNASGTIDYIAPYGERSDTGSPSLLAAPQTSPNFSFAPASGGTLNMTVSDVLFDVERAGILQGFKIFNSAAMTYKQWATTTSTTEDITNTVPDSVYPSPDVLAQAYAVGIIVKVLNEAEPTDPAVYYIVEEVTETLDINTDLSFGIDIDVTDQSATTDDIIRVTETELTVDG